jgi:hypothetical protein
VYLSSYENKAIPNNMRTRLKGCGPFHLKKHIFSKHVYQKYETQHTKYNTNTETNVAQSSIKIRHVPLKEISSQA